MTAKKSALRADREDLLQEGERLRTFLHKIGALSRYYAWRDSGEEPGVSLPRSPAELRVGSKSMKVVK